ncbi:hypothetical protein ABZZ79_28860 [Streptomyces sp. NPDC006458]|uniref:hypothetical protein n=1 Tax=Streptomyces sp. NPDC006458 TaxID=3154302 RepID=UPI0033A3390A
MPKKRRRTPRRPAKSGRSRGAAATPRKHPDYDLACPEELLVDEFGEEGAQWLFDAYERPLTMADLKLEQAIRRDAFLMDDPFTGPAMCSAQQISQILDMTLHVAAALADQAGTITAEQAREIEQLDAVGPIDHAAEGVDVVREAHREGVLLLNHRGMWDFA